MQTSKKTAKLFRLVATRASLLLFLVAILTPVFSYTRGDAPAPVYAATSSNLNYQARLLKANGSLVEDGYYNLEFKLYNTSSGGVALWSEAYYDSNGVTAGNDNRVRVVNGYISVNLGSQTAFPNINWDQDMWLTMNVGGSTQTATPTYDGEMNPRIKLTSVPYAFQAKNAAELGGVVASDYARLSQAQTFTAANTFRNTTDSTTTFQIQNASSQNLFVADTTNQRVAVGPAAVPANGVLTVGTNTTAASGGIYFGTDTNLYRSASSTLQTDDRLNINHGSGYTLNVASTSYTSLNIDTTSNYVINNGTKSLGNELENPGFESSAIAHLSSGWNVATGSSIVTDSANARTGNKYYSRTADSTTAGMATAKRYAVTPGQEVYFEGYIKNTTGTDGQGGFYLTFSDKDFVTVSFANSDWTNPGTSYTLRTIRATVPAGAAYVTASMTVRSNSTTGSWHFDDLYFTRITEQAPRVFKNTTNSTAAIQIQNTAGQNLFVADTTNQRLAVGPAATPANSVLTVGTNTIASSGGIYFGTDTNLYRSTAARLKTDGSLDAGNTVNANTGTANAVYIGWNNATLASAISFNNDTNLYRSAADILKTDDSFAIQTATNSVAAFQVQNAAGTAVLTTDTTNSQLIVRGANSDAVLGSNLITSNDYTTANWTTTGWTATTTNATHNTGNTTQLINNEAAIVAGGSYEVTFTVTGSPTAGESVAPSVGNASGHAVYGDVTNHKQVIVASSTLSLRFTPTSSWNGTISNVQLRRLTTNNSALNVLDQYGGIALEVRTSTQFNSFIGLLAGSSNVNGAYNTGIGAYALQSNMYGGSNTAVGANSLKQNISGNSNSAVGDGALGSNRNGNNNSAFGYNALSSNISGSGNVGIGLNTMNFNVAGSNNTAVGYQAGYGNGCFTNCALTGNSLFGYQAGYALQTGGDHNTLLGYGAGDNITTGARNIVIGYNIDAASATGSDQLNIGGVIQGNTAGNGSLTLGKNTSSTTAVNGSLSVTSPAAQILTLQHAGGNAVVAGYDGAIGYVDLYSGTDTSRLYQTGTSVGLYNPATNGTVTLDGATVQLATSGTARAIKIGNQSGTFTNNVDIYSNATLIQSRANSATAFQIQNAAGTSLLTANTTDMNLSAKGNLSVGDNYNVRHYSDDFETGDFSNWSSANVGISVSNANKYGGKYSALATGGGAVNAAAFLRTTSDLSASITDPTVYLRAYVNVNSSSGDDMYLLQIVQGASRYDLYRALADGTLCVYNSWTAGTSCSTQVLPLNEWHRIELMATEGTPGTIKIFYDGVEVHSFSQNTSTGNFSTGAIGDQSINGTVYYDDVVFGSQPSGSSGSLSVSDTLRVAGNFSVGGNSLYTGDVLHKSALDNTKSFQIQNAAGAGIFTVDTAGSQAVLGTSSSSTGKLTFANSTNTNTISVQSGVTSSSYTLTLPTALGADGDCIKQNGTGGILTFGGCGGSSSTATPSARVYNSTNTAVASAATTMLPYNTERFDTDAIHDNVTNNSRLTIKTSGKYSVSTQVSTSTAVTDGRVQVAIFKNGSTNVATSNIPVGSYEAVATTVGLDLVAGDYLETRVYNGSSVSITAYGSSEFSVIKDDGSGGTGGSVPSVRAESSVSQSLTSGSMTYLTFNTEAYDTNSMHDNVTNNTRLTANTAGKYTVFGQTYVQASSAGLRQAVVRKNGTTITSSFFPNYAMGSAAFEAHLPISTVIDMAAGDYIEMGVWQNSGGALNATSSHFGMVKLDGGLGGTLQGTYDSGNVINTTDNRDLRVNLADTATDSNFIVNVATGSTGQFQVQANGVNTMTVNGTGQALFKNSTNSTTAFQVQNASAQSLLTVDTTNRRISLDDGQAALGNTLVLDSSSAEPAGVNGAMYYDATLNKFRCYENGAWANCIGSTGKTTFVRKSADEVLNNSAVLQNDDELSFAVAASETWYFRYTLYMNSQADSDFQFDITFPSGAVCEHGYNDSVNSDGNEACANVSVLQASATNDTLEIIGSVVNGATAGNVTLRWSQASAKLTNTTVYGGSLLVAQRSGGASGQATLQEAYATGNLVTTTDARDLKVTLADTATDSNFIVNVATGSTGQFQVQANGVNTMTVNGTGQALFKNSADSTTAFQIQNAAGTSLLAVDTTNNRLTVGVADGVGTLLVLDTKNTAGDPTGIDGGMYYNSSLKRYRCYEDSEWRDCNERSGKRKTIGTNVTVTTNTYSSITDLNYTLLANTTYRLKCELHFTTTTATTGFALRPNYSFTPTNIYWNYKMLTSATTGVDYAMTNTSDSVNGSLPAANTPTPAYVDALITVGGTGGTLGMEYRSELSAGDTITANAGSNCFLSAGAFSSQY